MDAIKMINYLIGLLFVAAYAYQFLYIPLSLFGKEKKKETEIREHDYAVLICARNEEEVIGDLLDSIAAQDYPAEHIHCFVMADNCTDATAEAAAKHGAAVFERFNNREVGKGYALNELLKKIPEDVASKIKGYFVFDADNLLKKDYFTQMNKKVCEGNELITSYRNSKNYSHNWISAAYALWFLRESRYLNYPRYLCAGSGAVSGTGFYFSRAIAEENGGWPYHLLTEDIEFSADQILKGRKIAFCREAELYDEQPVTFTHSYKQRLRWAKGYFQVFQKYGKALIAGALRGSFACYDMLNTIMPAFFLSALSLLLNGICLLCSLKDPNALLTVLQSLGETLRSVYLMFCVLGAITTFSEWKKIDCPPLRKILYIFSFPLFMMTYLPIALLSLFTSVSWEPIPHTFSRKRLYQEAKGRS